MGMNFTKLLTSFLIVPTLLTYLGLGYAEPSKEESDQVEQFKILVKENEERVNKVGTVLYYNDIIGKWGKRKYTIFDIRYDIKKTDSLITPILGIIEFKTVSETTPDFSTKEEAEASNLFETKYPYICRVKYSWEKTKWVRLPKYEFREKSPSWTEADPLVGPPWGYPDCIIRLLR